MINFILIKQKASTRNGGFFCIITYYLNPKFTPNDKLLNSAME